MALAKESGSSQIVLSNRERVLGENDLIVSRTDGRGILQYVNKTFLNISGFALPELLGKPHSVIRHPDMPRCVFKLLWETISSGQEIFAYVKNLCKDGSFYWVFAHVTPTFDINGSVIGYHSNRRAPDRESLKKVEELYHKLLFLEKEEATKMEGLAKSYAHLIEVTTSNGRDYNEFILSI